MTTARHIARSMRALGMLALVLATALTWASGASAHAVLLESTPADGATTDAFPNEVTMRWSEGVEVAFGGIKVWGPSGDRVDVGSADVDDKVVRARIDSTEKGTYAASYRIVSGDGHPVRGAFTFHVQERSGSGEASAKAREASEGSRPAEVAFGLVRGTGLLATLLLAGGVAFVVSVAPGTRPRAFGLFVSVGIGAACASFVLDAAISGGFGLGEVLRWDVLRSEASTPWGRAALMQVGLLAIVAVWIRVVDVEGVRTRVRGLVVALPAFGPVVMWSIGGHAAVTEPVALRLPLDMLHVVAASVWLGGLVQLAWHLRGGPVSVEHVERWSRVALCAVVALVVSGSYAAYVEVGLSREAFASTTYGRLVVVKALLLLGTMPLAWFNRKHNVPGMRDRRIDQSEVRTRLRTYVRGEVAILVLAVAATAALIQTPPARTEVAPKLLDRTATFPSGATVNLVLDPGRTGDNEIHVYLATSSGGRDTDVTKLTLEASNEKRGIEGLDIKLIRTSPDHYTNPAATIPFSGRWNFDIAVQRGKYEAERVSLPQNIDKRQS